MNIHCPSFSYSSWEITFIHLSATVPLFLLSTQTAPLKYLSVYVPHWVANLTEEKSRVFDKIFSTG
jgi:hypothetical protein